MLAINFSTKTLGNMTPLNIKALCAVALALASALFIAQTTHAQQVDGIYIGKSQDNIQTDATTVVINPTAPGPTYGGAYGFSASVEGSGLSAPTVTLPGNADIPTSNPTAHNGGVLGYHSGGEWAYGSPNFNDWGATSAAGIDTLFGTGSYTVTVPSFGSATVSLATSLADIATVIATAPTFTITGGFWSGGSYYVNPNQIVTITTNAFSAFTQNANAHIGFSIEESNGTQIYGTERLYSDNPAADNFVSYTISPNTLVSGRTYSVDASFAAVMSIDDTSIAGVTALAYLDRSTHFTLHAVPEPATYAILGGVLALAVAVWRKRRWAA